MALISLQPWASSSVAPGLSLAPGLGVALDDAVELPPGGGIAVAAGQPARGAEQRLAAGKTAPAEGDAPRPHLGVAAAHAVTDPAGGTQPEGSPEPPASAPLPPSMPPTPVALPVAAPAPAATPEPTPLPPAKAPTGLGGHPGGPTGAGGPPVDGGPGEAVEVHEGDEYAFSFSFYIQPSAYRSPGSENLILRFRGAAAELPSFGLQLWDDGDGQRGLWASGEAMGGERFLAPLAEREWQEAVICFRASSEGDGFYLLIVDGQPIDARAWLSLIDSGSSSTLIETGLFRDGGPVADSPDALFGPARLGDSLEPVIP